MLKWKLMLTTLPLVVLMVGLAVVRDLVLHLPGVIEFSEVSPLLSAVALIVGFMLAGVLADFKESEKIPGEIATTLETIGDTVDMVAALAKDTDVSHLKPKFRMLVAAVEDWLLQRIDVEKCYRELAEFTALVHAMQPAAGMTYSIRTLGEIHNLRRLVTRVDVISRTSFIAIGYALLDLLVGCTLVLLLISNYKSLTAEYLLIALFSLVYIYMGRLIRDLDEPFLYKTDKVPAGSAEANPFPLSEYRARLERESR